MAICEYGCGQEATHQFKNGKWCCSTNTKSCPAKKELDTWSIFYQKDKNPNYKFSYCKYCGIKIVLSAKKRHERACPLNPCNVRFCPLCGDYIKDYKHNKTCSHKCGNNLVKSQLKKDEDLADYTVICFRHHKRKCIICGEDLAVAVHHYDRNHKNNKPENLVPICPTHHLYCHSKHYYIIKECVDEYVLNFISQRCV